MKPFLIASALLLLIGILSSNAATWSGVSTADTFVTTGPSNNLSGGNYGGAGALMVSPSGAAKGEFQSLLRFNTASAVSSFDTTYGAGLWSITSIRLSLGTNFGTAGVQPGNAIFNTIAAGNFGVSWMADDSWIEGTGSPSAATPDGVTFSSLSLYTSINDAAVGTFTWSAPGSGITLWTLTPASSLLTDIDAGGDVSFRLYAADSSVGYLFNSRSFSTTANRPTLILTAAAIPEPSSFAFFGLSAFLACGIRRLQRKH